MKYLFNSFGHFTFLEAHKVIQEWGIHPKDCVFLLTRGYSIPKEFEDTYTQQIHYEELCVSSDGRMFRGLNFLQTRKNILFFDEFVVYDNLQKDEFVYFSSNYFNDWGNLLVTHPQCVAYYILEDGSSAYSKQKKHTFQGLKYVAFVSLKFLYPRFFEVKGDFYPTKHKKFKGMLCLDQRCFPQYQQYIHVLGLPWSKIDLGFTPEAVLSIEYIFYEKGLSVTDKVLRRLPEILKKKYRNVCYKYHPVFNSKYNEDIKKNIEKMIANYFKELNMILLQPDIILENVLYTYKCDFYCCDSTVGLYGAMCGAKIYSFWPMIDGFNVNKVYPFFSDCTTPIS